MLSTPPRLFPVPGVLQASSHRCGPGACFPRGGRVLWQVVRPRGPPQPAQGRNVEGTPAARAACGKETGRRAWHGTGTPAGGRPAGAPERMQLMEDFEVPGLVVYAAAVLAGIVMFCRVRKRHGKRAALLYGLVLLLVCLACSPAAVKNFVLRALLRLL